MSRKALFSTVTALLLTAASSVHAAPVTVTFDEAVFTHGSVVGQSEALPAISTIYDVTSYGNLNIFARNIGGGPDLAVVFDSTEIGTRDRDLEDPFTNVNNPQLGNLDPGNNILIIQENRLRRDNAGNIVPGSTDGCDDLVCDAPDDEGTRPAGYFLFEFDKPINLESLDFFDIENAPGNDEDSGIAGSEIRFYDEFGVEAYANLFVPGTGGDNTWDRLTFASINGIYGLEVNLYGSGAIDNLTYSVVPVPASVWLFGSALLGFIGYSRRRMI